MIHHSFRIEILEIVDPSDTSKTSWWVTITGSGGLAVRTFGKTFLIADDALDFAKAYLADYLEKLK